ncbi:DUF1472 domain-containing protein [Shigella sonnei]|nr:DUF1472 domain-containing protein [Shigella sonnei]
MFHTIVSIKNDGHYFCRAGGNRPDGLNEPVTLRFRGLTLQLPPAVCVRLRLPLRPVHPRLIARLLWRHGTARCRRTCDYGGFGNVCCCTCCIRWNLAQIQLWKHRRTLV